MNKKSGKTRKPGSAASVKDLSVRGLSSEAARGVQGGVVKLVDKATPILMDHCAAGDSIKK